VLALVHVIFPTYFNWDEDLKSLSLVNRQMMGVHTFFIALAVVLLGLLCLTSSADLVHTKLGKTISIGSGFFWATRLIFQLFVYSDTLWKGKAFETTIHVIFVVLWVYLSVVFFVAALG